jgi:hypothetical protein
VEITTGGNCSMPTDVVIEATTISTTRNGRNSTVPIWKPAFSSDKMYEGSNTRIDTSSIEAGRGSLASSTSYILFANIVTHVFVHWNFGARECFDPRYLT